MGSDINNASIQLNSFKSGSRHYSLLSCILGLCQVERLYVFNQYHSGRGNFFNPDPYHPEPDSLREEPFEHLVSNTLESRHRRLSITTQEFI